MQAFFALRKHSATIRTTFVPCGGAIAGGRARRIIINNNNNIQPHNDVTLNTPTNITRPTTTRRQQWQAPCTPALPADEMEARRSGLQTYLTALSELKESWDSATVKDVLCCPTVDGGSPSTAAGSSASVQVRPMVCCLRGAPVTAAPPCKYTRATRCGQFLSCKSAQAHPDLDPNPGPKPNPNLLGGSKSAEGVVAPSPRFVVGVFPKRNRRAERPVSTALIRRDNLQC